MCISVQSPCSVLRIFPTLFSSASFQPYMLAFTQGESNITISEPPEVLAMFFVILKEQ